MAYFWRRIGDEFLLGSTNVNRIFCKEVFGTPWNTDDEQFSSGAPKRVGKKWFQLGSRLSFHTVFVGKGLWQPPF